MASQARDNFCLIQLLAHHYHSNLLKKIITLILLGFWYIIHSLGATLWAIPRPPDAH